MQVSYAKLSDWQKNNVLVRIEFRQARWEKAKSFELKSPTSTMLVGDRPGPSAPKDPYFPHTPFCGLKHCSGWLNTLLEIEGISERNLVWINSADQNGRYYDIKLLQNVEPRHVISLGNRAAEWMLKNGFKDFQLVRHPQAWKRFNSSERYPLLDMLKGAI